MSKKIVYTVCSANHLAYAKTMANSFLAHNPGYTVFIGLVDRIAGRFDPSFFEPHTIIEVESLGIDNFKKMSDQYTLIELNCAIKPFIAQYLFKQYQPDLLLYMDSDIFIYDSLHSAETALLANDIILTPHYTTPINDNLELKEKELLRSGLYNAGFIGMKNCENTFAFLDWWSNRLTDQCYYDFEQGLGVDQKWLDVAPLFFTTAGIFNHKGANVAYWNLHERKLSIKENKVFVNDIIPLLFLHISGYKLDKPEELSRHQARFALSELPVLSKLLEAYRAKVRANKYDIFSTMTCYFSKPVKRSTGIMSTINSALKPLGIKVSKS